MSNFVQIGKAMDYIAHRRMIAFWSVMAVMLPLPWLVPACTVAPKDQAHYDNCQVLSVYDGDTMTVNCEGEKVKVRLYCIDAPEMGQAPWGREARDYLRSLSNSSVRIEPKDRDRYGRSVSIVWSGNTNLNYQLVKSGYAVAYRRYCHDPTYSAAEDIAIKSRAGVWITPGSQQRPWDWRRR